MFQNLLNNFQKSDKLTVAARMILLFQLFTVYPLLAYMLRSQLILAIFKTNKPASSYLVFVNVLMIIVCIAFAVFMPKIGTILRYTGAISGSVHVFALPSLLHLVISHREKKNNVLKYIIHTLIPIIGILNLISQFFIKAS